MTDEAEPRPELRRRRVDAVFCMGGGYSPRLRALALHLAGALPADYDPVTFHARADMRPVIERGSAAMAALLEEDAVRPACGT